MLSVLLLVFASVPCDEYHSDWAIYIYMIGSTCEYGIRNDYLMQLELCQHGATFATHSIEFARCYCVQNHSSVCNSICSRPVARHAELCPREKAVTSNSPIVLLILLGVPIHDVSPSSNVFFIVFARNSGEELQHHAANLGNRTL